LHNNPSERLALLAKKIQFPAEDYFFSPNWKKERIIIEVQGKSEICQ
jgi:hypothetical protein